VSDAGSPPAEIWRMRRPLEEDPPTPAWPEGIGLRSFRPEGAPAVHALLEHAYRGGGGSVDPFEKWHLAMTSDSEFDPALCFLAEAEDGSLAGVALCWTSAFLKDLVVHESWRGRGLGAALVHHLLGEFQHRGAQAVELKVASDNPSGAQRLYERLGFVVVGRLPPV
jgi:ribosomal protein S18 acetylase RimI-like enzyme